MIAAHDADRLVQHEEALVGAGRRDRLAVDPLGLLGEPQQEVGGVADLVAGHADRLALLLGHQLGQLLAALEHELVRLGEVRRPLVGGAGRPRRERGGGGLDRGARVGDPGVGDLADHLAGGRVPRVERAPDAASRHSPLMYSMGPTLPLVGRVVPGRAARPMGLRSGSTVRVAKTHPHGVASGRRALQQCHGVVDVVEVEHLAGDDVGAHRARLDAAPPPPPSTGA